MNGIVVGIDAGGTSTRCLVVDLDGDRLGWARGPGANVNSSGDTAVALRAVLTEVVRPGSRVEALVFAAAGAGPSGADRAQALVEVATADFSVGRLVVHSDVEAAFAAGTTAPDGTVLIAGTGACAARISDFRVAARQDGHGYLLGDRGSAFWIGAAAARAVLAEIGGYGAYTALRRMVLAAVRADEAVRDRSAQLSDAEALQAAVYTHPPAWLGTLAPFVENAAVSGDPVATQILDAAVEALIASAVRVHEGGPLVLTGAVALGDGRVGTQLRTALHERLGVAPACVLDPSVGAAALALRAVPGVSEEVIRHLLTSARGVA